MTLKFTLPAPSFSISSLKQKGKKKNPPKKQAFHGSFDIENLGISNEVLMSYPFKCDDTNSSVSVRDVFFQTLAVTHKSQGLLEPLSSNTLSEPVQNTLVSCLQTCCGQRGISVHFTQKDFDL